VEINPLVIMAFIKKLLGSYATLGFTSVLAFAFIVFVSVPKEPKDLVDLPIILERGVLYAATEHSPSSYFVYRAEPMGFQLELLSAFCNHLGLMLEIKPENNIENKFECLIEQASCDIIALGFNPTYERQKVASFSEPYAFSRHVLVQRRKTRQTTGSLPEQNPTVLRDLDLLDRQAIFIQKGTSYKQTLDSIELVYDISIDIIEVDFNQEELVKMVADGEIDFTVCDEIVAKPNKDFFPVLDIETALTDEIGLSWAVRKNSPILLDTLNKWIAEFRQTPQFRTLFHKYFDAPRRAFRSGGTYHSLDGSQISRFDSYFKKYAPIIGWDWRMIASLAYQESMFVHDTASWAGAMGIMQIMPTTAESLGLDSLSTIEDHIRAGIRYLKSIDRTLEKYVGDSLERISFVLGAYNSGPGHVIDAIKLAEKHGKDPTKWIGNVDYFIRNKSRYYREDVVKHGYLRGWETYIHVLEIWRRFEHYRNVVGD
jgi:membrane-bound lytic murein transglycosylase F